MSPIVEKLKKLIAHERSSRTIGNLAEAESFATRIQEILARHKLSMSEVELEQQDQTNPIGDTSSAIHRTKAERWMHVLSLGVASSFYCESLWRDGFRKVKATVVFIRRESDRESAAALFSYLFSLGVELGKAKARQTKADEDVRRAVERIRPEGFSSVEEALNRVAQIYKKDFLLGYATALHLRLIAHKKSLEEAAGKNAAALVLRDAQAITEYCQSRFEVAEHRFRATKPHQNAFRDGYAAGQNVSISARAALNGGQ